MQRTVYFDSRRSRSQPRNWKRNRTRGAANEVPSHMQRRQDEQTAADDFVQKEKGWARLHKRSLGERRDLGSMPGLPEALSQKDAVIEAHQLLVKALYSRVSDLEQHLTLQRKLVTSLKRQLISNKLPLPDVQDAQPAKVSGTANENVVSG